MNWMAIIILTVAGMALIAVDFYLPGFVLGSIGVVLMLVATSVCYSDTESLNKTIVLFCVEVALGIGAGYASIKYFPKTAAGKKMILACGSGIDRRPTARRGGRIGHDRKR